MREDPEISDILSIEAFPIGIPWPPHYCELEDVFTLETFPLGTIDPEGFKPVVDLETVLAPEVFPKGIIDPHVFTPDDLMF